MIIATQITHIFVVSYSDYHQGAVDMTANRSLEEQNALEVQISEFGQCPKQVVHSFIHYPVCQQHVPFCYMLCIGHCVIMGNESTCYGYSAETEKNRMTLPQFFLFNWFCPFLECR